jgi:hypothetical protein
MLRLEMYIRGDEFLVPASCERYAMIALHKLIAIGISYREDFDDLTFSRIAFCGQVSHAFSFEF